MSTKWTTFQNGGFINSKISACIRQIMHQHSIKVILVFSYVSMGVSGHVICINQNIIHVIQGFVVVSYSKEPSRM